MLLAVSVWSLSNATAPSHRKSTSETHRSNKTNNFPGNPLFWMTDETYRELTHLCDGVWFIGSSSYLSYFFK